MMHTKDEEAESVKKVPVQFHLNCANGADVPIYFNAFHHSAASAFLK